MERTRSRKLKNEQQIATLEIAEDVPLDQGAPPVIAESSAQELEESPEQPEPAVQQVQEKEQEKQPEKVEEKPAAKKPAAKPNESDALTSNPFGIKVSEIPAPTETKPNPQRPFQDWYSIFVDVGANKNQKATDEFEELAGLVINSVAELIPYSDYTSLLKKPRLPLCICSLRVCTKRRIAKFICFLCVNCVRLLKGGINVPLFHQNFLILS